MEILRSLGDAVVVERVVERIRRMGMIVIIVDGDDGPLIILIGRGSDPLTTVKLVDVSVLPFLIFLR